MIQAYNNTVGRHDTTIPLIQTLHTILSKDQEPQNLDRVISLPHTIRPNHPYKLFLLSVTRKPGDKYKADIRKGLANNLNRRISLIQTKCSLPCGATEEQIETSSTFN